MSRKAKTRADQAEHERELMAALDVAVRRMATGRREQEYFRPLLEALVRSNAIPAELLHEIPVRAVKAEKTRFDQLYDAAMYLAFPGYRQETLQRLLGPGAAVTPDMKIWRIVLPEKFGVAHVLIRAGTFQEAFSLGCDYACRASLRVYKKIPADLTVRVMMVSEKALRRSLDMRWANRVHKRKQFQLEARVYTPKELAGARMAALGHPEGHARSLARYLDAKDLQAVLTAAGRTKVSSVETEVLKRRRRPPV